MYRLAKSQVERIKNFLEVMGPSDADPESELDWKIMYDCVTGILAEFDEGRSVVVVPVLRGECHISLEDGEITVMGR